MGIRILIAALALSLVLSGTPEAWAADDADKELAKKTQNPVADFISVPFQNNFNFNTGTKDATVYVLNVQPVIPIHLTDDLNLITRTIMPIINQPSLFPQMESAFGMGDSIPRSSSRPRSRVRSSGAWARPSPSRRPPIACWARGGTAWGRRRWGS